LLFSIDWTAVRERFRRGVVSLALMIAAAAANAAAPTAALGAPPAETLGAGPDNSIVPFVIHATAVPSRVDGASRLGRAVAQQVPATGESGFKALPEGPEAFQTLRTLVQQADRTLDLQYYNWRPDFTGHLLLLDVLRAADRGVAVRILLDDVDVRWTDDELARLNKHPDIEIRMFNPFAGRDSMLFDVLFDFNRITHRMHNKALIADGVATVLGGRNVGDRYFEVAAEGNYRDLDLLAVGPVAGQVAAIFDEFWNSEWSVEIEALNDGEANPADVREVRAKLKLFAEMSKEALPILVSMASESEARSPQLLFSNLAWTARAVALADSADKPQTATPELARELRQYFSDRISREVIMETAYLIPGRAGVDAACTLVRDGVRVRILTNSLMSNDVITAASAYRPYRENLLACGVELYEMQASPAFLEQSWPWTGENSVANLHSKGVVIDGRYVIVGSFNADPRSLWLNTEVVLLVHSEALADQVSHFIEQGMALRNAYRLTLENHKIVWTWEKDGVLERSTDEPGAGFFKLLFADLLSLLPIEGQL